MTKNLDAILEDAIKKSFIDGYKQGFKDGYDQSNIENLELPKPKLTGKFSISMGKFKCTGCTGNWENRNDAQFHSCKDYQ
jgi:hypothetical protein